MTRLLTGVAMLIAALGTNIVFVALANAFDYPAILREPPAVVLGRFAATASVRWLFAALAALATLLVPVSVGLRGLDPHRFSSTARLAAVVGVLAGVVQVVGLLRWVFAVPALAAAAADPSSAAAALVGFTVLHEYLGVGIGETLGYLTTAGWTVLVALGTLRRLGQPSWLRWFGVLCAAAVVIGVAEPFGFAAGGTVNFIGYVAWSAWLAATGVLLLRRARA